MNRPEDIPQDVWTAAGFAVTAAPEYTIALHVSVARAIMAGEKRATLAAREQMNGALAVLRLRNGVLRKQHGAVAQTRMDAERRERGVALDRDHWRGRAQRAEAVVRASGLSLGTV